MSELMYSTQDAANQLGVTVRCIEAWRLNGLLKPLKIEGRCYYTGSELKRFLGLPDTAALEYMHDPDTVAAVLGVSPHKVDQLRKDGKLTAVKAGRLWRYPESTIGRFLGLSEELCGSEDEDDTARGGPAGAQVSAMAA